mmetsp:Transcript_7558/g.23505  ORF Transcript_7558/g.23505 Transcript_7558/m.23505 type:complete len:341 (-) Transcript_7558:886-1908(-)
MSLRHHRLLHQGIAGERKTRNLPRLRHLLPSPLLHLFPGKCPRRHTSPIRRHTRSTRRRTRLINQPNRPIRQSSSLTHQDISLTSRLINLTSRRISPLRHVGRLMGHCTSLTNCTALLSQHITRCPKVTGPFIKQQLSRGISRRHRPRGQLAALSLSHLIRGRSGRHINALLSPRTRVQPHGHTWAQMRNLMGEGLFNLTLTWPRSRMSLGPCSPMGAPPHSHTWATTRGLSQGRPLVRTRGRLRRRIRGRLRSHTRGRQLKGYKGRHTNGRVRRLPSGHLCRLTNVRAHRLLSERPCSLASERHFTLNSDRLSSHIFSDQLKGVISGQLTGPHILKPMK